MNYFEKKTPEQLGISSKVILEFIDNIKKRNICMHSFMIMRHGAVAVEGYYAPFHKDFLHRMYSVSKSFVGAAIGCLCDEGKISLFDKVVKYFPEYEASAHPYVKDMTIRDMLIMATPFDKNAYDGDRDENWIEAFFREKCTHPAGTIFDYNTAATYMLDVIVEKVEGKDFLEYLKDRALRETGFSENSWCVKSPEGYAWGGSGVMATTRDLARFAQLMMNGGKWNGKQLISEEYVKAATSRQIDSDPGNISAIYHKGYGYQIWIIEDGFAFLGMGGQFGICFPKKDLLFVSTGDNQGSDINYKMIIDYAVNLIGASVTSETLPENKAAADELETRLASLKFGNVRGEKTSPAIDKVNGVTYKLNDSTAMSEFRLEFDGDKGAFNYVLNGEKKTIEFGIGEYIKTKFPETKYWGERIRVSAEREYDALCCGSWIEENKFMLRVYIVDWYFGNLTVTIGFKGENEVGVNMSKSAEFFLDDYRGFTGGEKA